MTSPSTVAGQGAAARDTMARAGVADIVEIRAGDAVETLAHDLPDSVDVVFLDGAKNLYLTVLNLIEPHLAPDAIVVADDANGAPEFLAHVRSGGGYVPVGLDDNVEISLKTAA